MQLGSGICSGAPSTNAVVVADRVTCNPVMATLFFKKTLMAGFPGTAFPSKR